MRREHRFGPRPPDKGPKGKRPWRLRVLGWGNLALGFAAPISMGCNLLGALGVFSVEWASGSIVIATIVGTILGFLTYRSGWGILHSQPTAFKTSCIVGGLTLGYTFMGILIMATSGRDRALEILIRHGSQNWMDWSLSHFQNSCLREIPVFAWWVLGLGTLLRFPSPGAPPDASDRVSTALGLAFCFGMIGGAARTIQLAQDTLLSSQR